MSTDKEADDLLKLVLDRFESDGKPIDSTIRRVFREQAVYRKTDKGRVSHLWNDVTLRAVRTIRKRTARALKDFQHSVREQSQNSEKKLSETPAHYLHAYRHEKELGILADD